MPFICVTALTSQLAEPLRFVHLLDTFVHRTHLEIKRSLATSLVIAASKTKQQAMESHQAAAAAAAAVEALGHLAGELQQVGFTIVFHSFP